ncbi:MAG: phospholipase D-like domain-containing protein, partial [Bacteroidota bacterium]
IIYGKTTAYGNQVTDTNQVVNHQVVLTGLQPATIYHTKLVSANAGGSTNTSDYIVSTSSLNSSGAMNVYFSRSVNTSLARGENAQTANLSTKAISRINAATSSIDVALYSLSGTVGANIATALVAAKNRGVKVRVIGEKDNQSTAPWTTLKNGSVPVIDDGFDVTNGGVGLMHNKFLVIDNRDTTSDTDDWVMFGSWNATDPGTDNDAQNLMEVQDKALANAYTVEFEEMWGSNTETANAATSRFGARKYDNTPHFFNIKGTPVESYFSPSDRTNAQIIKTVNKAKYSVNLALLTFTRSDIANALVAKKKAGVKIRGVVDNRTDSGSQYDTLFAQGVDIHLKANVPGLLHHKYAIIDADSPDSLQYVVTGSHNWSSAAENTNNENTIIIRSRRIANLYVQEFSPRYTDAGGTGVLLSVIPSDGISPKSYSLSQNYPNPFNPSTQIQFSVAQKGLVTVSIFDILGREVSTILNQELNAGSYSLDWNASHFSSGVYFYRMTSGNFNATKKMILQK